MGLACSTVRFLLDAHDRGVSFKNTLTLGRTRLYLLSSEIRKVRRLADANYLNRRSRQSLAVMPTRF